MQYETRIEEIKKELHKFDDFKFFDDDHHYEFKGQRVGMSVTRFIEQFANEFDQQGIAEKVAIKEGKTVDEVLESWKYKNEFACAKGTTCHEYAQHLWSGKQYIQTKFDGSKEFFDAVNKIHGQVQKFYDDYKNILIHIQDEQVIGSEEYDIASAVDHLFYNADTDELVLVDYKTNSILRGYSDDEKSRRYAKKMKPPLDRFPDDSLHHYYIQLSIYKYIIEKYTELKIDEMIILYMSENIDNYKVIEVPYLEEEVKKILESRRCKNMNSVPILLIGASGTGKSTSLRNFKKDEVAVVNVLGKPLPFKTDINPPKCDNYAMILKAIENTAKKTIVIDDAGYLLTNEFMSKASVKGYDKYNEMANNFFNLINGIKAMKGNKTVYLVMHEDADEYGNVKPKTIGKLLDDKVNIQGMFTVCIRSMFENGEYIFRLKTNGQDCVKTPLGMFEEDSMENDLKKFDGIVREFYSLDKEGEK